MSPVNINPHLAEVLDFLLPNDNVQKATTPEEKQEALLAYFRSRKIIFKSKYPHATDAKLKEWAADALEHKFVGSPSYPTHFRGKEEIDWDTNPYPDDEWLWQFHRFYWFKALHAAYLESKDERYAKEWTFDINSWIKHMHPYEQHKYHHGWRDLDLAIRVSSWSHSFDAFVQSPSCDSYTLVNLLYSLKCHLDILASFFRNKKLEIAYNWQMFELEALITGASVFYEFKESKEWALITMNTVLAIQNIVVLPDGVISEYIPSYHGPYPGQFLFFKKMCELHELDIMFPDSYMQTIEKNIQAVLYWSHPDGTAPLFGDAWLARKNSCRAWMSTFTSQFPERTDFLWFATNGKRGVKPTITNYSLPDAGYYMLRSGWEPDDLFFILKNTRPAHEQWHNQDDNMTFELSAYGDRLMTDSGCYVYLGHPEERKWFRSPMAHQMITIENQPISGKNARFIARNTTPLCNSIVLENEPYPGIIHQRTVILLDKKYILLLDKVSGKGNGKLRQHFQFEKGSWIHDANSAQMKRQNKANLLLISALSPRISLEEEEGWISYRYMKKERRPAFAFIQEKAANETVHYLTALIPIRPNTDAPKATIAFANDSSSAIAFSIDGAKTYRITIDQATQLPKED